MKDYAICTDSCADLSHGMLTALDIKVINLHILLNNQEYHYGTDDEEQRLKLFYGQLRQEGTTSTSQVTPSEYRNMFFPLLAEGKDILYIGFSSGLSATVDSARLAAKELENDFPDRNINVVDSLSASMGLGLLVWHAAMMREQGKSMDDVTHWVEANKLSVMHLFTVDDLNFLKRGGRLSGRTAFVGTVLNIKPVLRFDDQGHMLMAYKVRGRRKCLLTMVDEMGKSAHKPQNQTIFITHGDCLADAQFLAGEIRSRLGVKEIYINFVGPVIGGHSGPGTVALFYLAEDRNFERSKHKVNSI